MKILRVLSAALAVVVTTWLVIEIPAIRKAQLMDITPLASVRAEGSMPGFSGAVEWLNSPPLDSMQLRGKVVLVHFWTYSCINWLRTLPHVRAWASKYKDHGLLVIGVHTPEFGFEKDIPKIRQAMSQLDVPYAVAVDSNYAIWRAFQNNAWPALYLVDSQGKIRYRHLGEGEYERSERVIQQLLTEAGASGVTPALVQVQGTGSQAQADWANLRSPETYVGYARANGFRSPGGISQDRARVYAAPANLNLNSWALTGNWRIGPEAAALDAAGGRIVHRFHARDLHMVMGPAAGREPIPFRVMLDGRPPGAAHGADIDAEGRGVLVEHRLYQLLRQSGPVIDRQFEIEFLKPGVEAFAFTFG